MEKLDRSQPYGEVTGASDGHRYEQNHKLFDAQGNLFVPPVIDNLEEAVKNAGAPQAVSGASIRLPDGQLVALPDDRAALLALANEHLPVKMHPQTGAPKLRKALMEAFPMEPVPGAPGSADQVDQQLAG